MWAGEDQEEEMKIAVIALITLWTAACTNIPLYRYADERSCQYSRIGEDYELACSEKGTVKTTDMGWWLEE